MDGRYFARFKWDGYTYIAQEYRCRWVNTEMVAHSYSTPGMVTGKSNNWLWCSTAAKHMIKCFKNWIFGSLPIWLCKLLKRDPHLKNICCLGESTVLANGIGSCIKFFRCKLFKMAKGWGRLNPDRLGDRPFSASISWSLYSLRFNDFSRFKSSNILGINNHR